MKLFSMFTKNKQKEPNNIVSASSKQKSIFDDITDINSVEGMYNSLKKLANPDEVLRMTGKGVACLRLLENTGQVATCVDSRKAGVSSLNWRLIHKNDKYKQFYEDLFKELDIYSFISDVLNASLYGYQVLEVVWHKKDGHFLPKSVIAKPQEWFFFNANRELCFRQKGKPDGLVLTSYERKFLCPRHKPTYINPYGQAILSRCFWDVAFIKGGMEFWTKFLEKYGMPFLLGKYPEGMSDDEKEKLLESLTNMIQDTAAIIPETSSLDIKEAGAKAGSAQLYKEFITMCEKNIAKNILGQTLTTDAGDKGSYAIGKVHAQVRDDIVKSDVRLTEKEANTLLQWIHGFNFNDSDYPTLELYEDEDVNKDLADRDKVLSETGVKFTKSYFMKKYSFEEDEIELSASSAQSEFSESSTAPEAAPQDSIDEFIASFSDKDLAQVLDKSILPIIKEFSEIKDPEKTASRLAQLYPQMDSTELENTLAKSIFLSNIWGRINA